jgi:branched-subunit amino acid transport protein AzlD
VVSCDVWKGYPKDKNDGIQKDDDPAADQVEKDDEKIKLTDKNSAKKSQRVVFSHLFHRGNNDDVNNKNGHNYCMDLSLYIQQGSILLLLVVLGWDLFHRWPFVILSGCARPRFIPHAMGIQIFTIGMLQYTCFKSIDWQNYSVENNFIDAFMLSNIAIRNLSFPNNSRSRQKLRNVETCMQIVVDDIPWQGTLEVI